MEGRYVFTVSEMNQFIKELLDNVPPLQEVLLRGEISNYKVYPSGHHYFTLKDSQSSLKCVMFKTSTMRLRFRPENGMQVIAAGRISVYPRDGAYQLYCTGLTPEGVGDLSVAFEQLKEKLRKEGLFDAAHKKPLPVYPRRIAIVTSPAGAAVHDMIRILRRRYPLAKVLLLPVRVQGTEAPAEIAGAIRYANRHALELLEQARQEGLDVGCDVYPYTAGSTQLIHILPPDFLSGGMEAVVRRLQDKEVRRELARRIEQGKGFDDIAKLAGWDGIRLTSLHCPEDHPYQGKSIAEIAAMWGQNPLDCCCDLLVREHGEITMVDFMASEEDIVTILQNPLSNVISDATYPTDGMPHPRVYGTFVHLLEHFVKERGALTASQAVHKMTQKPARVLHLDGKGVLAAGMDADINVFDLEKLHQPGTYENPRCLAVGMDYVLVDGAVAVEKGRCTGVKPGRIYE